MALCESLGGVLAFSDWGVSGGTQGEALVDAIDLSMKPSNLNNAHYTHSLFEGNLKMICLRGSSIAVSAKTYIPCPVTIRPQSMTFSKDETSHVSILL